MNSQNVRRVVTLSASAMLIAALSLFCFFSCRQSGQTIRQLTGVRDSEVSAVVISSGGQSMTVTDQAGIETFLSSFADTYRLTPRNDRDAGSDGGGYLIRLYLGKNKSDCVTIQTSVKGAITLSSTLSKNPCSYNLIDKGDFIHRLNAFADSVDPHWVPYAGAL